MPDGVRLEHDWLDEALPDAVIVGDGCWIYSSFAFLHYQSNRPGAVDIGDHSGIYNGTFFDLGPSGQVIIGRYCSLVGVIISTNSRVAIGDYTFVAHEVVIADKAVAAPSSDQTASAIAGASLGRDVWVGMGASIIGGVTIGDGAIIAAGAVIQHDVPPYCVAAGNPAEIVRKPAHRQQHG
jgi:acetyltransferase-like isoleucine patch superfamily enzyme